MDQIIQASSEAALQWSPQSMDSFATLQIRALRALPQIRGVDVMSETQSESAEITGATPDDVMDKVREASVDRGFARSSEALHDRVKDDFLYHSPKEGQPELYTRLRNSARGLAILMVDLCPPGRELSTALTNLETAVMHANAAIARHG